jgi:hypothetical protein
MYISLFVCQVFLFWSISMLLNPDPHSYYGLGSRSAKSIRILDDPDPQHCPQHLYRLYKCCSFCTHRYLCSVSWNRGGVFGTAGGQRPDGQHGGRSGAHQPASGCPGNTLDKISVADPNPDPDLLVRGMDPDPDPSISKPK